MSRDFDVRLIVVSFWMTTFVGAFLFLCCSLNFRRAKVCGASPSPLGLAPVQRISILLRKHFSSPVEFNLGLICGAMDR